MTSAGAAMADATTADLYFAYGSNLHPCRLARRVPSARFVATAILPGRRLAFHKQGKDGSGKCDAPLGGDGVHGALFRLTADDVQRLDDYEGRGRGYEREVLHVVSGAETVETLVYLAQPSFIDSTLRPYDWYKRLVLEGAAYHGFPAAYLASIAAVPAQDDPDTLRAAAELACLDGTPETGEER